MTQLLLSPLSKDDLVCIIVYLFLNSAPWHRELHFSVATDKVFSCAMVGWLNPRVNKLSVTNDCQYASTST